jgi:hypothetical protein
LRTGDFPIILAPLEMTSPLRQGDGRLWAIALMLSLGVNFGILGIAGFTMLKSEILRKTQSSFVPPQQVSETTMTILPEFFAAESEPKLPSPANPEFARTSADQAAPPPENAPFIGERNTQATSDRSPSPAAPPLPSQAGIEPKNPQDFETTESTYQDGKLETDQVATPQAPLPSPPLPPIPDPVVSENTNSSPKTETPGNDEIRATPPPPDRLLSGPSPVDVPVPKAPEDSKDLKPTPEKRPKDGVAKENDPPNPKAATAKPSADPGFRGNQRKTAIVGSISRTGRSALNVADSPLGRYQAQISRAVEQEWQRNCVRHRDFITPGFLTVRFFVETSGKIRTVRFVGEMETGEVQKGFTLNAIRDAEIPAMPAALKKEFDKEPLELIFNFYF